MIDDEVHIKNDDSQYEGSNVESASEDRGTKEESNIKNNAQRQEHRKRVVRKIRRLGYLEQQLKQSSLRNKGKLWIWK